jgi:hypothetical protein
MWTVVPLAILVELDLADFIRSSKGAFLMGFTGFGGIGCNLLPELLALKHGYN